MYLLKAFYEHSRPVIRAANCSAKLIVFCLELSGFATVKCFVVIILYNFINM